MIKVKSNNLVRTIPETSDVNYRNILYNANFRDGIINQKGLVEYDKEQGICIDGWTCAGGKVTISFPTSKANGYITFTNEDTTSRSFAQNFDQQLNKKCVAYVDVNDVPDGAYIWGYIDDDYAYTSMNITEGTNVVKDIIGWRCFGISIPPQTSIKINCLKLEYGNEFTGIPKWNYEDEWARCREHFKIIETTAFISSVNETQHYNIPTFNDIPFNKTPTLINAGQSGYVKSWDGSLLSDYAVMSLADYSVDTKSPLRIVLNKNCSSPVLQVRLILDSNNY